MNVPIYDGNPIWNPDAVPFGFYNNSIDFQNDCVKVAEFCATRLGYPLVDIELQSSSFFTAFEEAITVYGNELYAYLVRDNMLTLEGFAIDDFIFLNDSIITPNLGAIIKMSEQYGAEAGTGGNVPWYKDYVELKEGVQDYDLKAWAKDKNISGSIEIKRVFYESPPAIVKFFDPYAGTGAGVMNVMDSFGWSGYSPAINFVLMPLNYDLQVIQQIEMSDTVRRSNYSFEVQNNKLRLFPIPDGSVSKLYFQFLLKSERLANSISGNTGSIANVSNVPYTNPVYTYINSVGRSWIFEYALTLSKEMLGYVRGKYTTVPIPGSEVTMNQQDLLSSATAEKTALIDRLRAYLDETSREKLLERRSLETEYRQKELNQVPQPIYIA